MSYWFFLSYAHSKQDSLDIPLVENFFKDLCVQIAGATKFDAEQCGFLDSYNLKAGDAWKEELATAVRTCQTFVCLLNARYFSREYCGREWRLFEDRCNSFTEQSGVKPKLLIPVLWQTPLDGSFPSFAMDIQFGVSTDEILDEDRRAVRQIATKGMRYVAQRRKSSSSYGNAYLECVEQLAEQIIKRAKKYSLPSIEAKDLPSLDKISPKFPISEKEPAPADLVASSSVHANFAVVAGKQHEMTPVLGDTPPAYGTDSDAWIPFHPESDAQFFIIAQSQANENRLRSEWIPVDKQLVKRVQKAEEDQNIVIMVVDPVTARLPQYAVILREFDRYSFRNCVILIPWTGREPETDQTKEALETVLRRHLDTANELYLRTNISTVEELESEISLAIKDLSEILAAHRKPQRIMAKGRFDTPPSLISV